VTNSILETSTDLQSLVRAAAEAVIAALPVGQVLLAGEAARTVDIVPSRAVTATFTGSMTGEIVIVVDRPIVEALAESPLGPLDLAQALRPVLTAATQPLGQVALGPARELDSDTALRVLSDSAHALVAPLVSAGEIRAAVGLSINELPTAGEPARPAAATSEPFAPRPLGGSSGERTGMDLLRSVEMEVTAELGRTRMTLNELLSLTDGAVIELDRAAGAPADVLVNGRLIARGEVVVIDENFGLRITEIVSDPVGR
jgi:flagellar motor switch protein FliN/FliY